MPVNATIKSRRHPDRRILMGVMKLSLQLLVVQSSYILGQKARAAPVEILQAAFEAANLGDRYSSTTDVKYRAMVSEGSHRYVVGTDSVVSKNCDGDRLRVMLEYHGYLSPSGSYITRSSRRETVFASNTRTYWWYPNDKPLSGTAQVTRDPKRVSEMRRVEDTYCSSGCFLDGCVDGLGNIIDIARGGEVSDQVRHETILGTDCEVIESGLRTGHATLWIAASRGNNILKYVLETNDASAGEANALFEATKLQNVGDRVMIAAGRSTRSWNDTESHARWHETVDAQRIRIDLQPEFIDPNLFTTRDVPNGIRTFLDDQPNVGVDFVWYNGQPVAKVDPDLFSELDHSVQNAMVGDVSETSALAVGSEPYQQREMAAQRIGQIWIIICGAGGIFLIAFVGIYFRKLRFNGD